MNWLRPVIGALAHPARTTAATIAHVSFIASSFLEDMQGRVADYPASF
jgi:hypothetical protein